MEHQRCQIGRGGSTAPAGLVNLFWSCMYYDAPKTVSVKLEGYGVAFRVVFFIGFIIGYFGIYNLYYNEAYKEKAHDHELISYAKIRGSLKTILSAELFEDNTTFEMYNNKTWDANDDIFEKTENSFFIPTNLIITANQTKRKCADYPSKLNKCKLKEDCQTQTWISDMDNPEAIMEDNGIRTGKCVVQDKENDVWTCQYEGWCPPKERERQKVAILNGTKDFAVQLQQLLSFPKFGIELSNLNSDNKTKCTFDSTDADKKHCRNFLVSEMVRATSRNNEPRTFDDLAKCGGVVKISIHWECFLWLWRPFTLTWSWVNTRDDKWIKSNCLASYKFTLMEGKKRPWPNETTLGIEEDDCRGNWEQWYIAKSHYYRNKANESEYQRNFRQVYGILFKIETTYDVSRLGAWNIIILLAGAFVTVKSLEFIFYIIFHLCWCLKPWGYHCSGRYHTLGDEREREREQERDRPILGCTLCNITTPRGFATTRWRTTSRW